MFKIGETVWCLLNGKGIVENVLLEEIYPVTVLFENERCAFHEYYTIDGKYNTESKRTLYFSEPTIIADETPFVPVLEGKLLAFESAVNKGIYEISVITKETKEQLYLLDGTHYLKNREEAIYELVKIDPMNYEDKNAK